MVIIKCDISDYAPPNDERIMPSRVTLNQAKQTIDTLSYRYHVILFIFQELFIKDVLFSHFHLNVISTSVLFNSLFEVFVFHYTVTLQSRVIPEEYPKEFHLGYCPSQCNIDDFLGEC